MDELDPEAAARYADRWLHAQRRFFRDPEGALGDADGLVREVMRARNCNRFDRRIAERYETARALAATPGGEWERRQAMVHFDALVGELLGRR